VIPQTATPARDHSIPECQGLWGAVIECAILDCKSRNPVLSGPARAWILSSSWDADFTLACQYAGLEAAWVRSQVRAYLAEQPRLVLVPPPPRSLA